MAKLHSFASDAEALEEGKWFAYHDDFEMRIASTRSQAFQQALTKLGTSSRRGFRASSDLLDPAHQKQRDRLAVIHLLKGWKGLTEDHPTDKDDQGEPVQVSIPFSTEKALEIFLDPRFPGFLEFLWASAADLGEYSEEEKAARGKD